MCALCGVLKWWPQMANSLGTGASLTKCCQSLKGFSVMLNSNLSVEPVVMDVSQTTNQNQHAAFLNHDACAGLCLFVNIFDRCFLVFTKTRRCAHMLSCVALGGTSSVKVNCSTSIHELVVGAMNGCFFAALRARFRDGKTVLLVNCNTRF